MTGLFSRNIGNVIILIDELIFFRGFGTTNQIQPVQTYNHREWWCFCSSRVGDAEGGVARCAPGSSSCLGDDGSGVIGLVETCWCALVPTILHTFPKRWRVVESVGSTLLSVNILDSGSFSCGWVVRWVHGWRPLWSASLGLEPLEPLEPQGWWWIYGHGAGTRVS